MVELPVLATAWSSLEGYSSVLVGLASSLSLVELEETCDQKRKFRKIQEIENRKTCFVRGCCSKEEHTIVAWLVGVTDMYARMGQVSGFRGWSLRLVQRKKQKMKYNC
jgi:hypothetical protein